MKKYLLSLLLMLFIVSCMKEIPTALFVSPTSISFESDGGSESIAISANKAWSASSSAQWCTVSSLSGEEGEVTILVSTKPNEEFEDRSCEVTIVSAEISKTISINQASKEGVVVSQSVFNVSKEAQNLEINIESNTSFEVVSEVDWIKCQTTKGLSSSSVVLRIQLNDTYRKRSGVVKFVSTTSTTSITINQDVNYGIEVTPSSIVLTKDEQSFDISAKANVDYDIIIPDEAKNWLSVLQVKSPSENIIIFRVTGNTSGSLRETIITLKQKNGDLNGFVSVIQASDEAVMDEDQYGNTRLRFDGMYYEISSTENLTVSLLKPVGTCPAEVVVPKYIAYKGKLLSVESISWEAFKKQTSLKKITFPSTLKSINRGAFTGCTALSHLIFEDSQESIQLSYQKYVGSPGFDGPGQGLFYDCPLTDVYLGRTVKYDESWYAEYGYSPFYGKKTLVTFICSNNVTRFGKNFILGTSSLSTLVLSDNITSMGGSALGSCGVEEINLPARLSVMEHSVLSGSAIKKVTVPASLKKLPDYTFNACKNLEEVHLQGLEEIVSSAFDQCTKIKKVYCYTATPPKFVKRDASEIRSFETTVYAEATLYVPKESIEQYKNADHWKKFWSIEPLP